MALSYGLVQNMPVESAFALLAIMLGTLGDIAVNRVYDADDDALEEWKRKTNPISNGEIGKSFSWIVCVGVYVLSTVFSILTNDDLFMVVLLVRNLFGFFYSAPPIRAKSKPVIDLLFHLTIIDVAPAFMAVVYTRNFTQIPLSLLGFMVINSLFTQTSQEIRDFDVDKKAKLKATVQVLGERRANILQKSLIVLLGIYVVLASAYCSYLYVTAFGIISLAYIVLNVGKSHREVHATRMRAVLIACVGVAAQLLAYSYL
jgi:4-hydroxybenzoate polyprenyltransferase